MLPNNLNRKDGTRHQKAVKMANELLREIQQGIGVVGGTKRKGDKGTIRETDRALLKGLSSKHRDKQLPEVDIEEFDLPYKTDPKKIEEIFPDISYISGLSIANPAARLTMHKVLPEDVSIVTLEELVNSPRVPVIADVLESKEKWYSYKAEDFRVTLDRPHWILKIVNYDFPEMGYPWITKGKDGNMRIIPPEKSKKYLTRELVPVATGTEWIVDYGILARLPNPFNPQKRLVLAGGSHWLSTFAINSMLYLVKRISEMNTELEGAVDSMSFLFDALNNSKGKPFMAVFRITDNYFPRMRKIEISPLGVFTP